MGLPARPYIGAVHKFTESGDSLVALEITEIGEGIWQLRIPHGTDPAVVSQYIRGTVFDGVDLAHPRIYAEDVDHHTLVYAREISDERTDPERGANPR